MTTAEALLVVRRNQMGILFYNTLSLLFLSLWSIADIIPGFSLYDGTAGVISSYCRTCWWIWIEWIVLLIVYGTTYFGLVYSMESGTVEKGVPNTTKWCTFAVFCVILGWASNAILIGLLFNENFNGCNSTLCSLNQWALITLISFLFAMAIIVKPLIVYRIIVYRINLDHVLAAGKIDMTLTTNGDVESKPTIKSNFATQLLAQQHRARNQNKKK